MNEKQVATQFKPGNPGGPGRPRRTPMTDAYREILESEFPKDLAKKMGLRIGSTWRDAIAAQAAKTALRMTESGNGARKEIREAIEGRARQRIEFGEAGDRQAEFVVVYASPIPGDKIIDVTPEDVKQLPSEAAEETPES
jgi:hypothetical protein